MACGGFAAAYFVSHRSPSKVFLATALTMALAVLTASVWFLPFLERYKSPRPFAFEVKKRVPASAALYVYADAMHDYNFYTERAVISVAASQVELQRLLLQEEPAYMIIKGRDLDRAKLIKRERIVFRAGAHGRIWYLITLGSRTKP
jgi:hypothetical protein